MFIVGNFLIAVASILAIILNLMWWAIIIRAILSWFPIDPYNPIVRVLDQVTEPLLMPIRRYMPPMGIDFSPIVAIIVLVFIQNFLVASIYEIGLRMKYQQPRVQYELIDESTVNNEEEIMEETGMVRTGN